MLDPADDVPAQQLSGFDLDPCHSVPVHDPLPGAHYPVGESPRTSHHPACFALIADGAVLIDYVALQSLALVLLDASAPPQSEPVVG